jgi:class 3 adenylate cyclase/tetratricopeptide (TPR) repeat protein
MENLSVYLPMDRRQALVRAASLPERTHGAALFADISGFTRLTEVLVQILGPQRGVEELTHYLNLVYDALIVELYQQKGSVIGFSGDAITCWFDHDDGRQATTCALAMQHAMQPFGNLAFLTGQSLSLAVKVVVAVGPARRFLVGDPEIQIIEAISGDTFTRLAAAEHQANKGEVLLDKATCAALGEHLTILEWRRDTESQDSFAVIDRLTLSVAPAPWEPLLPDALSEDQLRPWVLPAVYDRLQQGKGEFLAEIRPGVALFLNFQGIDFENDAAAGEKLDRLIRQVQQVLVPYDGALLQLTIGDKGSYLYAAFGAPVAHEDNTTRALSAAIELRKSLPALQCLTDFNIGISQGSMRTGAYGSSQRRTYGLQGDHVNLAARLMQAAAPGEILVSQVAQESASDMFIWRAHPPLQVKGKAEPVIAFTLEGKKEWNALGFQEGSYALPMVGRVQENALAKQKIELVIEGRGQIIGISGEAGLGKSRLIAEVAHQAHLLGMTAFGGECQSYGTNISYLVWQAIWSNFFGLDPAWSFSKKLQALEQQLEAIDLRLLPRLPLLGSVLNLSIPDNDLTATFDAKLRKSSLEALLVDCLRSRARRAPLFLVLEDCHWLDPLSRDLIEVLGRTIVDLPVMLVLAYRPVEVTHLQDLGLLNLPYFTAISLDIFNRQEAERLTHLKLEQLFGSQSLIADQVVEHIVAQAEGNPFYIEELVNYLKDQGANPQQAGSLEQVKLPSSLHSLILSRIDQRTENQKITLRLASIIGRSFIAAWLWGAYPQLEVEEKVRADLRELSYVGLTVLDAQEPELTYLFKQIITQEVAYESLPFATRALLHDQLGAFIESAAQNSPGQFLDLLAFHYERTQNEPKKRQYLLKAAEAARARFANQAAIDYYRRVLALLQENEKAQVMLSLGQVLALVGEWQQAEEIYHQVLELSQKLSDHQTLAWCWTSLAELAGKQGLYSQAEDWLEQAGQIFEQHTDMVGSGQVFHYGGTLAAQQGKFEPARLLYQRSLEIRRQLGDEPNISSLLSNLGILARLQGDLQSARALQEESLAIRRKLGNKSAIAVSLNNLGNLALDQGNYSEAQERLEEAVTLQREVGDRYYIANALNNLANVARAQGRFQAASRLYQESLEINRDLGAKWSLAYLLEDIGCMLANQDLPRLALRLVGAAGALRQEIGARLSDRERSRLAELLSPARLVLDQAEQESILSAGADLSWEDATNSALQALQRDPD